MDIKNRTIALLIDSDNVSAKYLDLLINEVSKFGNITYKRIYGDFTSSVAASWRKILNEYAIEPIQQYLITTKLKDKDREFTFNVTDSAMVIDAMDILYKHNADCVCLATSDSDFTRLAIRFRNENYVVIGVGEKKTPQSFIAACHRFILIDALLAESEKPAEEQVKETKIEIPTESATSQPQAIQNEEDAPAPVENVTEAERQVKDTCVEAPPTEDTIPQPQAIQNDEKQEETQEENTPTPIEKIVEISKEIISEYAYDDGWLLMSTFSHYLYDRINTFDSRHYGYKRHTPLFQNLFYSESGKPIFELKTNEKGAYLIRIAEE